MVERKSDSRRKLSGQKGDEENSLAPVVGVGGHLQVDCEGGISLLGR